MSSSHPYQLIISDIDGTLLDDEGNLPELNRRALAHCKRLGVFTCLATGRRWTTCRHLLERLELRGLVDFCILNNGMIVLDVARGKILVRRDFPYTLMREAARRLATLQLDPIVLGHNPDGLGRDVFYRHDALANSDFVGKNPAFSRKVEDWGELEAEHLVELILLGQKEPLEEAAESLDGLDLEMAIIRNTYYREYMLEITPKGVSKLLAARELAFHLGISETGILAVGDSENDYELLKHMPMSVAVANAAEGVKSVARELTGSNAEGGVGQAIFRHLPA